MAFSLEFSLTSLVLLLSLQDSNKGPKGELILGTASLNLAEYTSASEEVEIILPLSVPNGSSESSPSLHVCQLYDAINQLHWNANTIFCF